MCDRAEQGRAQNPAYRPSWPLFGLQRTVTTKICGLIR